jgi:hypothetical protein
MQAEHPSVAPSPSSVAPREAVRPAAGRTELRRLFAAFVLIGACAALEDAPSDATLPLLAAVVGLVALVWPSR